MVWLTDFFIFFSQLNFAGNRLIDFLGALAIFLGVAVALKIFQLIVIAQLKKIAKKTKNDFDDSLISALGGISGWFYFLVALYSGSLVLNLPEIIKVVLKGAVIAAVAVAGVKILEKLIDYGLGNYFQKKSKGSEPIALVFKKIIKIALWLVAVLLVLSNLGINVTSLIAGLGVGGIAVALAVQNILGDLFSSFSLYLDRPFKVGDFIMVGGDMGVVEKIGLKTTRIRTLQGEELVVSNNEMTSVRIQNFQEMKKWRIVFEIGVVYNTPAEKLEAIPKIIKEIISKIELAEFDRCHFKQYGDSGLIFEIVYYVKSGDYYKYMDVKEAVNLEIYRKFVEAKIEFAYPTQTIQLEKK